MYHCFIKLVCRPNSNCLLSRWKGPAFMITSGFLVCCELYGWTTSGRESSLKESYGEEKDASVSNGVFSEEDFPTISEWLDDRDVLYKERSRCVAVPNLCSMMAPKNATAIDFIAINFDPVHSEYLSSYPNCPLLSSVWPNLSIHKTDEVSDIKLNTSSADGGMCLYWLYICIFCDAIV